MSSLRAIKDIASTSRQTDAENRNSLQFLDDNQN
uniref:Uncharacterized protein n=1 Tax=Lepeophtheirus salmonis TaxID=72036 RepID=A0A0K2TQQ2_LEPSM